MSTCARCGLELSPGLGLSECGDTFHPDFRTEAQVPCRDRELANLRALLRSVTRKLELAHEELALRHEPEVARARELVIQVLETLS